MLMNGIPFGRVDISGLESQVMIHDQLQVMPYEFYSQYSREQVMTLMFNHGIYVLPTSELIEYLKTRIEGVAIEIGAGHGAIAMALGIPATDSYMQDDPKIQKIYQTMGQPTVKYGPMVERLDFMQAITRYRPQTVIGAFITHKWKPGMQSGNMLGVDENYILKKVKRYIMVGNLQTHGQKPLLRIKHEQLYYPWIITRSERQDMNRIFIW